ncbi:MAG: terminase small subunit [Chlorobiaceae bacterium]
MNNTPRKLTPKQEMFCREYLVDLNGTQAAIRAGYSAKTAHPQAARALSNVTVKSRIDALKAEREAVVGITAEYVLRGIKETTEEARASGEKAVALKGYELLGRHLVMFTDKKEVMGAEGKPLIPVQRFVDSTEAVFAYERFIQGIPL